MRIAIYALGFAGLSSMLNLSAVRGATTPPPPQTLFVANSDNDTIVTIGASGAASVFANSGLSGPYGIAFDSAGNLYVANSYVGYTGYSIEKFSPLGVGTVFAGPETGLARPTGLAFDSAGNLFVANAENNTIQKFDSSGAGTIFASTGLNSPTALAFNSAGTLFVANGNGSNIEEFDSDGVGKIFASFGVSSPTGMAFDTADNLYVANQNGIIEKFDPSGVGTVFATLPLGVSPVGLAFDSSGNLFATTSYNTIMEFDSSGVGTVFASSGMYVPTGLAFQPVPEPSTFTLLIVFAGAFLSVAGRRARIAAGDVRTPAAGSGRKDG